MRILVLVLGAVGEPWSYLIHKGKATWAARDVEGIDVTWYFGGDELRRDGRDLTLPVSDAYWDAGEKTLACFEHMLAEHDFDLVFRTNCSTYLDLPNLRAYAQKHARATRFYCGVLSGPISLSDAAEPDPADTFRFAYGFGYFLSRDLVELVVRERVMGSRTGRGDDVALADFLVRRGIPPEPAPHVGVANPWTPRTIDTTQFIFRCKTDSSERRGDVEMFRRVDDAFARARQEVVARWFTPSRRAKLTVRKLRERIR